MSVVERVIILIYKFLKRTVLLKLDILRLIYIERQVSIQALISTFNYSRSSIKRALTEINCDIKKYTDSSLEIEQGAGFLYKLSCNNNQEFQKAFFELRLVYLKQNYPFEICEKIFFKTRIRFNHICEELSISKKQLNSDLCIVNSILNPYRIQIIQKGEFLCLSGNEAMIRLIIFSIISKIYLGLDWPFPQTREYIYKLCSPKIIAVLKTLNPLEEERVLFLLAICHMRVLGVNYVDKMSEQTQHIIDIYKGQLNVSEFNTVLQEKSNEICFANFFFRLLFPKLDNQKTRYKIGNILYHTENECTTQISYLLNSLNLKDTSNAFKYELTYYLTLYFLSIDIFGECDSAGKDLVETYSLVNHTALFSSGKKYSDLKTRLLSLFPEGKNIDFLTDLVFALLQKRETVQAKIYILFSNKSLTNEIFIANKLLNFYGSRQVQITTSIEDAEIIITDTLHKLIRSDQQVVFIEETDSEQSFNFIVQSLDNYLLKKRL